MTRPLSHHLLAAVWTVGEQDCMDLPSQGTGACVVPKPREASPGVTLNIFTRGVPRHAERSATVFLDIDEALALASEIMDALEESAEIARRKEARHAV